jgi:hypothetical protein
MATFADTHALEAHFVTKERLLMEQNVYLRVAK